MAEAGGGKCYESPEKADFFSRDFPITRDVQDIWRWLLIAAVVLFYLDVFVRRVVAFWTRKPRARAAAAADPRLAVLLERKAQLQRTTLQVGETVVRSSLAATEKVAARTVLEEAISSSSKEPPSMKRLRRARAPTLRSPAISFRLRF